MIIIGITGGIGSGKSTITRFLEQYISSHTNPLSSTTFSVRVVDADQIAREIVEPGEPALVELARNFENILHEDGTLNRAELARQAFSSPQGRELLNSITHPLIAQKTQNAFSQARLEGVDVLIYDMPLLLEQNQQDMVDYVVVVDAPDDIRIDRLNRYRGIGEEDARRRIAAQMSREDRLSHADYVIDNSGSVEQSYKAVEEFWANRVSTSVSGNS